MTLLEEIRQQNGWTIEEASNLYGIDVETLIECESSLKHQNMWAIDIILEVLELEYEDIVFAL